MRSPHPLLTRRALIFATTGLALVVLSLPGCGGHHHHRRAKTKAGSARLVVDWPAAKASSNVFADKIQNLQIFVRKGTTLVDTESLVKPAGPLVIDHLTPGDYKMDILAREAADGSGPIVAGVGIPLTIVDTKTVQVKFSLTTPVDHNAVWPSSLTLEAGSTGELILTAYDASGAVTLGSAGALRLGSSDPSVATSDVTGLVTAGDKGGTTILSFTDTNLNTTLSSTVTVLPPPSVTFPSGSVSLGHGESRKFVATVVGLLDPTLQWNVFEKAGGTVDDEGRYTAPKKDGVYHVVATSVSRPDLNATATVVVGSASVGATVH